MLCGSYSNEMWCRIDGDGVIKVGDFGLSEDVYRTGYFKLDKGSSGVRLPFKWLAPESIRDGVFNEKTDVVSSSNSSPDTIIATYGGVLFPNPCPSSVVIWCDMLGDIHLWQTSLCWCGPM